MSIFLVHIRLCERVGFKKRQDNKVQSPEKVTAREYKQKSHIRKQIKKVLQKKVNITRL